MVKKRHSLTKTLPVGYSEAKLPREGRALVQDQVNDIPWIALEGFFCVLPEHLPIHARCDRMKACPLLGDFQAVST
ncbi:hypothetical protein [uncultured Sphaerochaeta sp.]|uniref:hypothetical protein n=1 Tax=uncultured Sphaerochaeta sp. TaxID=886478 RepID=UPI002A0A8790|nr:hypothetical protein [uncultured Sphaerochaeta sp.]